MNPLSIPLGVPSWVAPPILAAGLMALWTDVRTRRVPNLLTGTVTVLGLVAHVAAHGPEGLGIAVLGMVAAGALLLPGWYMGWMGGGDVKLVAAVGAWLGFPHGVIAALAALVAGGVIALAVAARRRILARSLWGAAILGAWLMARTPGMAPPPVTSGERFPFAGAVLLGALVAMGVHA